MKNCKGNGEVIGVWLCNKEGIDLDQFQGLMPLIRSGKALEITDNMIHEQKEPLLYVTIDQLNVLKK